MNFPGEYIKGIGIRYRMNGCRENGISRQSQSLLIEVHRNESSHHFLRIPAFLTLLLLLRHHRRVRHRESLEGLDK